MELKITIFLLNILNIINQLAGNSFNQVERSLRKPKFFFPPLFLPLRKGKISHEFVTTQTPPPPPPPMPNCLNCNPGTSDSLCIYPDYVSGILPGFDPILVTHDHYRICTVNQGIFDSLCIFKCHKMCNPNLTLVGAKCGKMRALANESDLAANCNGDCLNINL